MSFYIEVQNSRVRGCETQGGAHLLGEVNCGIGILQDRVHKQSRRQ